MTWSDERTARLRELWADPNMNAAKIAAEIGGGITRNAVLGKAHRLGLPARGWRWGEPRQPRQRPRSDKPRFNFARTYSAIKPEPFEPRTIEAAPSLARSILSVAGEECRWPTHEDAETGEHRFCGHPSASGKPYCEAHCRLAYHRPAVRSEKQRASDARLRRYAARTNEPTEWMAEEAA